MKFKVFGSTSCVILFLAAFGLVSGCTRQADSLTASGPQNPVEKYSPFKPKSEVQKEVMLFSKDFRESLHFAASLERETLRLISKNTSLEPSTLFSVLSYGFDIASGTKKMAPRGIDCSRFEIRKRAEGGLDVLKICQKPAALIATVEPSLNESHFKLVFKVKEWASVVGISVTLTNSDIICEIEIKDKKLSQLSCEKWAYFLSASDASATEVHLKTFSFHRQDDSQLKIAGGFYRDLIERKKIEITVPLQGKIKLIEKEIEVKDDFIEKPPVVDEQPIKKDQEIEKNQLQKDEDYQKFIKTEGTENNPDPLQGIPVQGLDPNEIEQGQNSGGVPKPKSNRGR